jgi:hypothetical protein
MEKSEPVKEIIIEVPSGITLTPDELAKLLERFNIRVIDTKRNEVVLKIKQP